MDVKFSKQRDRKLQRISVNARIIVVVCSRKPVVLNECLQAAQISTG